MSAHEQLRQMLDQLMGTGRDGENNRYKVQFTDPRVCKSFLLGCCPHDILASTRMDLGECPKIHDLALRADYEAGSKTKDYYYDIDAMEHLETFIADCDRRTELAKRRLSETQEELSSEVTAKANIVHQMGEEIGKKLAKAEQLGAEGNVDESLKLMEEVEEFRNKKMQAEMDYRNSMPASSYQQQKLRVCEVCSAYLGIHDNDRRLADHFGGKLHLGFIKIREKLEDLKKSVAEKREKREQERTKRFDDRDRDRDRGERVERDRERERPDRGRGRDFDRDRRFKQGVNSKPGFRGGAQSQNRPQEGGRRRKTPSRSRSRSRDRRRKRSRSRSKDKRRKSRSRSKSRRSSSKRSRSRSRSRHSRSRRSHDSGKHSQRKSREGSDDRKHSRKRDSRSAEKNDKSSSSGSNSSDSD